MELMWNELDVNVLRILYEKESAALKASLIKGTLWDDLKEQRQKVTELSIALHKKIHSSKNPAEHMDRGDKRTPH